MTSRCDPARAAEAAAALERVRLRRRSILEIVRGRAQHMRQRLGLGREEQLKLERIEESIRSVERRLDSPMKSGLGAPGQSCLDVQRAMETATPIGNADGNFPQLLKMHLDLIALALELDVTRVATISLSLGGSGGAPMRWLQWTDSGGTKRAIEASHHNVTHGKQRGVENHLPKLKVIDRWNCDQFGYLLGRLKEINEGDRTALDNSIVWYASDLGDGTPHSRSNLPCIVAGRAGGALSTGRYLRFDKSVTHQRLLLSFLHKLGATAVSEFGRPGASAGGPIL